MTSSPSATDQDLRLLTTKLYVPPVPAGFVPRPRLIDALNAGPPAGHKMTLISSISS
mgnify:CR=1 FL=1